MHTRDFNPNSKDFVIFKRDILKQDISPNLIKLCDQFYELQNTEGSKSKTSVIESETEGGEATVYQCKNCLTIYDEDYGDELNNIASGTRFDAIPYYRCPTCDSPGHDFILQTRPSASA
nr:rubredoxin [Mucilaginibacter sp. PPCGB 2223]